MNIVEALKTKQDYFNNSKDLYKKINEGTEILFYDLCDILEQNLLDLPENKLELVKELIAHTLHYHYTILHSPLNTDAKVQ